MGKRKPPVEEGAPLWMCTYGDLMSLLLCFFIMLFAISIIAEIKWEAFVETLQARMGYSGMSPTPSKDPKTSPSMSSVSERSRRNAAMTGGQETPGKAGEEKNRQTMSLLGTPVKGGLIRFNFGSEILTPQAKQDLGRLFPVLRDSPRKILVSGHAAPTEDEDGVGIYSRDLYLARARAIRVMEYLISLGLKKEFFQVSAEDSTSIPNRGVLPEGTDPKLAGASVAVYLIDDTVRPSIDKEAEEPQDDSSAP